MLACRHFLFLSFVFGLLVSGSLAQEVREWTDVNGKKLNGKFVELTADDKVKIDSEGEVYAIPLNVFVAEDQQYARDQAANASEPDMPETQEEDPFKKPDIQVEGSLEETRLWTDYQGRTVTAHFVRMFDGKVALMHGSKGYKLSYHTLSQKDQEWLRKHLSLKGETSKILSREEMERLDPEMVAAHRDLDAFASSNPSTRSGGAANSAASRENSRPGSNGPPLYIPPTGELYAPPGETRRRTTFPDAEVTDVTMLPDISTAGQEESSEDVAMNTPQEGTGTATNLANDSPGMHAGGGGFPNQPTSQAPPNFKPGYCPGCNQELPVGYGPGDHCPRCKIYLESWVQPGNGAPIVAWYQSSTFWYVGGAVILIAGFGILGARRMS